MKQPFSFTDPELVLPVCQGTLLQGTELHVSLPPPPAADSNSPLDLTLSCTLFSCLASGVCVAAAAKCVVHFTYSKEETTTKKEISINVRLKL